MKALITLIALISTLTLHASTTGAVFTTGIDGTPVNGNIYPAQSDVYLNGGPGAHGKCSSAGLPDGDYYFVVTDPNTSTVLSTDAISQRKFRVSGGAIVSYLGSTHLLGTGRCSGNITVQLAPYKITPNPGGEYKVSVSRDPTFPNSATKTDNWKIRSSATCARNQHVCVSCPKDVVVPCTTVNGSGAIVSFVDPIVLPAGTPFICTPPSGSFFAVGTTVVTVIARNAKGQSASCQFNVTVGDCPQFTLECPADIVACADGSGVCTAAGLFVIPPGDENVVVTSDYASDTFPLGVTTVTLTASQVGTTTVIEQCSFTVTVNDCSSGVICAHVGDTDTGSPIAGWRVVLSGAANGVGYTDAADGSYCFSGLLPGTYTVTEIPPAGCWYATTATAQTFTVSCGNLDNRFDAYFGQVCRCSVQY